MALISKRIMATGLAAALAIGPAVATGLSTATYKVETDKGDGAFAEAGTLEISAMTPNLAGWKGSFTDAATGAKDSVIGLDSAMLSGRSGDYMALAIGGRVCLVEAVTPATEPRLYTARCTGEGEEVAASYRLTETASQGTSAEP